MTEAKNNGVVLLLSGGIDSTTLCALAKSEGKEIYTLSFDYGQKHKSELSRAAEISTAYGAKEHYVFPVPISQWGGSALTDSKIEVGKTRKLENTENEIPATYVPARNIVFLSIALCLAKIKGIPEIWLGANEADYIGYPDCREEFFRRFEDMAQSGLETGDRLRLRIVTPLLHKTKREIITLGMALGVDYSKTLTCYSPDDLGRACGECEACVLRKNGFRDAGIEDPTLYSDSTK